MYVDLHCLLLSGLPLRGAHEFKWRLEAYDSTLTLLEFVVSFINQYAPLFLPTPSPCFLLFLLLLLYLNIDGDKKKPVPQRWSHHFSPYMSCHHIQLLYILHKKNVMYLFKSKTNGCKTWVQEVATIIGLVCTIPFVVLSNALFTSYMLCLLRFNKTNFGMNIMDTHITLGG